MLGLLTLVAAVALMQDGPSADRRFRVTGWGAEASLATRSDENGGVLFAPAIRFVEPPEGAAVVAAYRLDLQTLDLQAVKKDAWDAARGNVVRCEVAGMTTRSNVRVEAGELRIGGKPVPVSGTVRDARLNPDGRLVAVLSASGVTIPRSSTMPTLGGSGIAGWRYHHLVEVASGKLTGSRVALGFGVADPALCWSPNGEVVVYADAAFTDVALVVVRR